MCKITMKAFKAAEKGLFGNISAIAKKLGVSRKTLYRFLAATPEAAECIAAAREEFDDIAEESIRKKIMEGDTSMLKFYASTKLRKRGYSQDDAEDAPPPEFRIKIESGENQ
ncbi:MAG: hypothetical protein E7040_06535 [Lentisphaerae bacterium]|nr:hypothetical protein [Lentisphaerota bacterium]